MSYRIICSWCQRDLGKAPTGCTGDTHTVCKSCEKEQNKLLAEMIKEKSE